MPQVTANPPVLWRDPKVEGRSTLLLPIWRELPRKSACMFQSNSSDSAAVLHSTRWAECRDDDAEESCKCSHVHGQAACSYKWAVGGTLKHHRTWLIESSIVTFSDGLLLQLFRTTIGKVYRSLSHDGGIHWTAPEATSLPNPNSKVHALVLSNGLLAVCYNAHTHRDIKDGVRSFLSVAISVDRGQTWDIVAELETAQKPEGTDYRPMFHYPTMYQRGCTLFIVYTVSFNVAGTIPVFSAQNPTPSHLQTGIRIAKIDMRLYDANNPTV